MPMEGMFPSVETPPLPTKLAVSMEAFFCWHNHIYTELRLHLLHPGTSWNVFGLAGAWRRIGESTTFYPCQVLIGYKHQVIKLWALIFQCGSKPLFLHTPIPPLLQFRSCGLVRVYFQHRARWAGKDMSRYMMYIG